VQEPCAGLARLFRMELGSDEWAVLDGCHETVAPMASPGDQRRSHPRALRQHPVAHAVRVHEEEALLCYPIEQPGLRRCLDRVPAHVRQHIGTQPLDDTRPLAAACGGDTMLQTLLEQDL
jgi:hypothetical protein